MTWGAYWSLLLCALQTRASHIPHMSGGGKISDRSNVFDTSSILEYHRTASIKVRIGKFRLIWIAKEGNFMLLIQGF